MSKVYSFGASVACEPFKQQSIEHKVVGGMVAPVKKGGGLVPLKVIFGNAKVLAGSSVYVSADMWASVWAKRVHEINGEKIIVVPESEIVLVETAESNAQ